MGPFDPSLLEFTLARGRRMSESVRHVPVLGREAVEMLGPREGGVYIDATFGAGGYSRHDPGSIGHEGDRHRP